MKEVDHAISMRGQLHKACTFFGQFLFARIFNTIKTLPEVNGFEFAGFELLLARLARFDGNKCPMLTK
jgi:hypothetical protein